MGLILDTTELISAERKGVSVDDLLAQFSPDDEVAISIITVAELNYGVRRAKTELQKSARERFLLDVISSFTILPLSIEASLRAGELNADMELRGERLALPDLLIAATALTTNFALVTRTSDTSNASTGWRSSSPLLNEPSPPKRARSAVLIWLRENG